MPTVEERLAALEKQMAAWMDQRPTTYYTHQYSGEEIDSAVGRAVTGGALDTSVTNVSNQLGTFVRPNLLDNWFFGRPVDQRGGYIIPSGTQIYADSALTDTSPGVTTTWRKVEYVNPTYCIYRGTGGNSLYYVKTADVVRGYTGNQAFIVDRWRMRGDAVSVGLEDDGLVINCDGKSFNSIVQAYKQPKQLLGKRVVFSVLVTENTNKVNSYIAIGSATSSMAAGTELAKYTFSGTGLFSVTVDLPSTMPNNYLTLIVCAGNPSTSGARFKVSAAKLELGDTQTLAHQDAGNWMLNEVPDYGEQLRRCQRYYLVTSAKHFFDGWAIDNLTGFILVPVPTQMRTKPIITILASGVFLQNDKTADLRAANFEMESADAVGLKIKLNGLNCSVGPFAVADAQFAFSSDL